MSVVLNDPLNVDGKDYPAGVPVDVFPVVIAERLVLNGKAHWAAGDEHLIVDEVVEPEPEPELVVEPEPEPEAEVEVEADPKAKGKP